MMNLTKMILDLHYARPKLTDHLFHFSMVSEQEAIWNYSNKGQSYMSFLSCRAHCLRDSN